MIDTHTHLMFPQFQDDLEAVLARAHEAGVKKIVNVGCGINSSLEAVKMADGKFLYATIGLHPYDADDVNENLFKEWEKMIVTDGVWCDGGDVEIDSAVKKIVAIGETGLDYFKSKVSPIKQKESFRMHLELAAKVNLPVIVHNRNADEDCFEILESFRERNKDLKVVFHCYGSSLEFACKVWEAGYLTSFTGIITYPSAEELREVVKEVPMDKFLVETDCPYLAPQKYRGERNEPAYVTEVVKCIAEVKGVSVEEVDEVSTKNAFGFFKL